MDLFNIKSLLSERLGDDAVIPMADMSEYCSFKCGGKADLLVIAEGMDELRYALYVIAGADEMFPSCGSCSGDKCSICESSEACSGCGREGKKPIPYMVIGNGSNILVRDGGYEGILIKLGEGFSEVEIDGTEVRAGASALLSKVAKDAAKEGLTGFEFASGIPGSTGGGLFMNAGAYGGEMKDVVKYVKAISRDGMREYMLDVSELDLSYRHSIFGETGDIITEVVYGLEKGNIEEINEKMKELAGKRTSKQPLQYPSCGSFFKRPEGFFAGALIEGAGLKGLMVGGAQVSQLHAGFLINKDNATATDVINLMKLIQNTVYDKYGVKLTPEVRIIGRE
ncbi:MAG: UDP-N-acetylmuramate dehydrogenase [Clostridiales bacterium]|nr:UDP-N-acetylmuramate dehydrogenase [Clostridiales bacterium]